MNEPPTAALPRYASERALPGYSYVPGKFPHPVSDPAGHSFGKISVPPASDEFAYAMDLFNHGYYWEAHEAWESLWHSAGRVGPRADYLKGLIKLAAAGVKAREGNILGVQRHARRAQELFGSLPTDFPAELSCDRLGTFARQTEQDAPLLINTSSEPVVRVFGYVLAIHPSKR